MSFRTTASNSLTLRIIFQDSWISKTCGAWLTNEIYNHYKNDFLNDYTDKIKKLVTESALFINDFLIFLIDFLCSNGESCDFAPRWSYILIIYKPENRNIVCKFLFRKLSVTVGQMIIQFGSFSFICWLTYSKIIWKSVPPPPAGFITLNSSNDENGFGSIIAASKSRASLAVFRHIGQSHLLFQNKRWSYHCLKLNRRCLWRTIYH